MMNRIFTVFFCFLLAVSNTEAQTVQVGTGTLSPTNTLYGPVYRYSATSATTQVKCNILYTQAELAAAGITPGVTITTVEFNKTNPANFITPASTFNMYMYNSTNTSLSTTTTWASILASHTQVYSSSSFNLPGVSGWVPWNITPFVYTGGALEIATELVMGGNGAATDNFTWEYTDNLDNQIIGVAGTGTTLNGTVAAYKERPNIRITYIGSQPCTDPPTAGDATATPAGPVCPGTSVLLNLANNSTGTGQTYQWQSSPNNTTYTDFGSSQIGTATTINPATTAWYRAAVTCGTSTTYSTPVEVQVLAQMSGNYTINSAVVTGGTNFQSFTDLATALGCAGVSGPVVVDVVPGSGPYNEQATFTNVFGASATNTITINGNGETLTYNSSTTAERAGIKLDNADYFTIDSLTITATGTYGFCVHLLSGSSNNTITNCTLNTSTTNTSTTNYAGIAASGSATSYTTVGNDIDSNTFSNNTIVGGYYGIKLMGNGTTDRLMHNVISNNVVSEFYSYGIHLDGHDGALVEGNEITRPTRTSVTTCYGIYFTDVINGRISKNRIHNPMGGVTTSTSAVYAIYFTTNDATATTANIVSNNAIYNINNNGIIYAIYNVGSDYAYYYHNTISLDYAGATTTSATRGFYQTTLATGLEFINNIVTISRGGNGTKHAIYLNTTGTTLTSNRNVLYMASTGGTNDIGFDGVTYPTLTDWQGAGYDLGSQAIDPQYTNMNAGDFTPMEAGINNLGLPLGITSDILGNPRNVNTPDPGAFEFGLPPCTEPPNPGDAIATPTTACAGQLIALNLQNNSSGDGQTYQWQSSPNNTVYTNFGTSSTATNTNDNPTSTTWYRAAVTCGTTTTYSTPIQVTVTPGISGTYTINSAVITGGTNFQTFNDFAAALGCGVTGPVVANVVAGSGPYNEQVTFGEILGVSSTNTITINGNGETLTYASTTTGDRAGIKLDGSDYFRINNLVIEATGTYGFCVQFLSGSSNNIVDGCTLNMPLTSTSANFTGIAVSGSHTSATTVGIDCDSNTFSNNTINGGYYGIKLMGNGTTDRFIANQVLNNTVRDFYGYGIHLDSHDGPLVEGNDVSRPNRTSSTTIYGIYFTDVLSGRISKNRIHDPMGSNLTSTSAVYPIYFTTCDATASNPNIVSNNVIYDINNSGIIYGIYNIGSDYAYYYHNTISLDYTASTSTSATRGFYYTTAATGIEFKNNIITIGRGGTGAKHGIYLNATGAVTDYNDIYMWASAGSNAVGYGNGNTYNTLTDWQGAGFDVNGADLDPVYQNIGIGNLTPTNVTLDNLGTPVGIATDILNTNRSATNPDMGAYEFLTIPCADPTGLTVSNITGSSADLAWDPINLIPGFEYVLDQNPGPPAGNGTLTTTNSYNATGLTISTQYYFHVRTVCGNGLYSQWVTLPFVTPCPNAIANMTPTGTATICQGDSLFLSVGTDPNYTYQWQLNSFNIAGATDSVYYATSAGTYTVVVSNGVGCSTISSAIDVSVNPVPTAAITGNTSICFSGSVTLSATSGTGLTYQWQEGGVDIPGATSQTYTTSDSGSYTVRVTIASTGCDATSAPANVVINSPEVLTANDSFNCGPGSVTLTGTASSGATLTWYDIPGGTVLGTGNTFNTPVIGTTTTYYVTAGMGNSVGSVGPLTPQSVGAGSGFSTTAYWLLFDVLVPTTLVSVDVFPTGTVGSNASINIEDNLGNVIHTTPYVTTVTGGATAQTVLINFPMAPGLQYRMRQGTATALFRNTAGAVFPYTSSAINITGHNFTTPSFYYFFYNWQFTTGCESAAEPVVATINPLPTATATAAGPTAVCIGDLVTIDATVGTGYSYQWQMNGADIAGATNPSHVVNMAGAYRVIVSEGPCMDTSNVVNITVNTPPASDITPSGPVTICQGSTFTLNANTGTGLTYQWQLNGVDIAGATSSSFAATAAGDYTVTVSNGLTPNCSVVSPITTLNVIPGPTATATPVGPTTVCDGEAVVLNANTGSGLTYQWQEGGNNIPGATTATFEATTSGVYTVLVNNGVCTATSGSVNVTVHPPLNPVATQTGNVLSTGSFNTYQWFVNNILLPGATNQTYTYIYSGDYYVVVGDANGCKDTSNVISIFPTSVNNVTSEGEIKIYPNPATSIVYIEAAEKVDVIITTVEGKLVTRKEDATFVELDDIATGVYMIKVVDKNNTLLKVEKLIKTDR